jgi:hypothetical protein
MGRQIVLSIGLGRRRSFYLKNGGIRYSLMEMIISTMNGKDK